MHVLRTTPILCFRVMGLNYDRGCQVTHIHPAVLIVEDQPDLRDLLQFYLHRKGYSVDTAADGREALEKLDNGFNPCVILLDLMMPVMDGTEFRQQQLRNPD